MQSKYVREEVKYCELEAENNAIRPRILFWVEISWNFQLFLTMGVVLGNLETAFLTHAPQGTRNR